MSLSRSCALGCLWSGRRDERTNELDPDPTERTNEEGALEKLVAATATAGGGVVVGQECGVREGGARERGPRGGSSTLTRGDTTHTHTHTQRRQEQSERAKGRERTKESSRE